MSRRLTEIVQWRSVRVEVQFYYVPGCGETGPSYSSGGEPACPAEVDTVSAHIVDDDDNHIGFLKASLRSEFDRDVYDQLVLGAEAQLEPDPDYEREKAMEDRL